MLFGNNFNNYYGNDYGNGYRNNYENSKFSSQLMVDKQKQSLKYSYETLGNLLSAAENFAGLANEKYGSYNYSKTTDYNGLKSEFAWELNCFNLAMETYQKKYGPYQFPPDCPKERILNDIQIYIQKMQNNKDKMLYYMMIDIINGKKVNTDFTDLYKDLDKNANNKFDPRKLNKIVGPLNQILDQAENDAEKGNMDLLNRNKATEKAKHQLKNIPNEQFKLIKVIKGETGKLVVHNNKVYFISDIDNSKRNINLEPSKLKIKAYYIINQSILYVQNNKLNCIIYSQENQIMANENNVIKKETITFNNANYNIGIYQDTENGQKYSVLYQSEEDDLK